MTDRLPIRRLLVANRAEIAIRIMRTARDLGIESVAVYAADDAASLHRYKAPGAVALPGSGAAAYLDMDALLAVAADRGCDAVHPGYGFLSENPQFAQRCRDAGLIFVGPSPALLALFGDKQRARAAACEAGVPVLPGTDGATRFDDARDFFESLDSRAMVIKAVAGGGGRGMRVVTRAEDLPESFARCESEARAASGDGALYVEQLMPHARHIEVQILGDGTGAVTHVGERDCSIQRRHQKLVEIAPAPCLPEALRDRIIDAAVTLASAARYENAGTFEFLVDAVRLHEEASFAFIEANPRLQVEHTLTEEVFGVDLVAAQLGLAAGRDLGALGLNQDRVPPPRGCAVQVRVNMERMQPDGAALPAGGRLAAFAPPLGPGVRVDTFGYAGYEAGAGFDSLLAKVIVRGRDFTDAAARTYGALSEFQLNGVPTNLVFLQNLLRHEGFTGGGFHTRFIDDHLPALTEPASHPCLHPAAEAAAADGGPRLDLSDWASILSYGRLSTSDLTRAREDVGVVAAPMPGRIIAVNLAVGERVSAHEPLFVMESMKMEHEIRAPHDGVVRALYVAEDDVVSERQKLALLAGEMESAEGG